MKNGTTLLGAPPNVARTTMKALVYTGDDKKALLDRPVPSLAAPTDAIVKMVKTTICGTDLHILKGDVPTATPGRILGHEGIGIVDSVGAGVSAFKPGDRVLISCITSCATCAYCRKGMFSHCERGGWILGNAIDGTQAEFVRIPFADTSLYPMLADDDEDALVMCSDVLPTAYECGVLNGKIAPGRSVAIVGAGAIGLAALLTAQFYAPSQIIVIDLDAKRLETAKALGATHVIDAATDVAKAIAAIVGPQGVDSAIEAVGIPVTFELCEQIIAPGGHIANVGVHGKSVELHLEKLWDRNVTITTRLVDTASTPTLLTMVRAKRIDPKHLITHRFTLDGVLDAYEAFGHAAATGALKVVIAT
jgi:alcohol dehydrogenase